MMSSVLTKQIMKKIFNNNQAEVLLKQHNPHLFGKKTKRTRNDTFLGNDIFEELTKLPVFDILSYTRNYSIYNPDGKYYNIHNNLDWTVNKIKETTISKELSPCHPENFSESVVKPLIRKIINNKCNDSIEQIVASELVKKLELHTTERINQQLKADYSEYLIIMNCPNVLPTLKHTKGADMYLVNDNGEIDDLNIKTTRSIWNNTDPEKAITALYENQGKDRFECTPRLYIYLSDKKDINDQDIVTQMNKTYEISFKYNKQSYNVSGCRLIII